MVQDGVVAAQYVRSWQRQPKDAVPVGSGLHVSDEQPARGAPVLARCRRDGLVGAAFTAAHASLCAEPPLGRGGQWTDADEYAARQDALAALVLGLLRRCRVKVHLGLSELGEQGSEQRGPLLQAIQRVLRIA